MALDWATYASPMAGWIIMLTDSTATIRAFAKDRSSEQDMMRRCRRQTALQTATDTTDIPLHLRTDVNPADYVTRGEI